MSEARVQEEWVYEQDTHERPHLHVVPEDMPSEERKEPKEAEHKPVSEPDLRVDASDFVGVMDAFDALMLKARQYPLLTAPQEKALARKVQRGLSYAESLTSNFHQLSLEKVEEHKKEIVTGRHYNNEFCNHNLRWLASIALDYYHGHPLGKKYGLLDLFQEGYLGLEHAVDKFDPDKGFKFSTYATDWIRQSIDRALKDKGTLIRAGVHHYEGMHAFEKLHDKGLSDDEISKLLDIDQKKIQGFRDVLMNRDNRFQSLDKKVKGADGIEDTEIHEFTHDPRAEEEFNEFIDEGRTGREQEKALNRALNRLEPYFTEAEQKLLRKMSTGERLSKSEDRLKRKVQVLAMHPAVWSQIVRYAERTGEVKPRGDWREKAACIDLGEYYVNSKGNKTEDYKEICGGCAVRAECELFLITNNPDKGVWVDGRTHSSEKTRRDAEKASVKKTQKSSAHA